MNRILSLILLLALLCACAPAPFPDAPAAPIVTGERVWPTLGWPTSTPEEQGLDSAHLDRAAQRAEKMGIASLLVFRHGYLVHENYFGKTKASTRFSMYSVTKSFTSTLAGIAVDQGYISSIDTPVREALPNLVVKTTSPEKDQMTLRHLLTMTSGLDWEEGDPVYSAMYASQNWVNYVMDFPMSEKPGSKFLYCSGCSHLLSAAVHQAVKNDLPSFAELNLFGPLGITNYYWEDDAQGIPIGGWGLNLTARDMAKLGYLYLNKGQWNGMQILSEAWINAATKTQVETGDDVGYGYQWWVDSEYKAYYASGRYGQFIYVVPRLDMIVVTTTLPPKDTWGISIIHDEILPAIID